MAIEKLIAPAPASSFTFPRALQSFNVPLKTYLASHPEYTAIISGAQIFDNEDRILLVQRASHDTMPNLWEIPGGTCDEGDESILHAVAREVWEETGLKVSALKQTVPPHEGQVLFTLELRLKVCKYTFEVEVESTQDVKLDPNEHQNYVWATEEECRNYEVKSDESVIMLNFTSKGQEATIWEGFRIRKAAKSDGP